MQHPNFTLWTGAQVTSITVRQRHTRHSPLHWRRAARNGRQMISVTAQREVLLSAGSIGSPQILELSGIGDAQRLQALGIPVVKERYGVGENLQDHLQIRAVFRVKNTRTLNTRASSLWGKAMIGIEYLLKRSSRWRRHQPAWRLYPQRPVPAVA